MSLEFNGSVSLRMHRRTSGDTPQVEVNSCRRSWIERQVLIGVVICMKSAECVHHLHS